MIGIMPRKKDVKLSGADLLLIIQHWENGLPFANEFAEKLKDWAQGEIERREKSGRLGGRPKKVERKYVEPVIPKPYALTSKGLVKEDAPDSTKIDEEFDWGA